MFLLGRAQEFFAEKDGVGVAQKVSGVYLYSELAEIILPKFSMFHRYAQFS
jgi:hypothetical protein